MQQLTWLGTYASTLKVSASIDNYCEIESAGREDYHEKSNL